MTTIRKVSIIIPTGGRHQKLAQTLESIQRFAPSTEVIVIGDRYDDRTHNVLHEDFPSVTYLESRERSAIVKRNAGIARASREILVFVDDDVIIEPNWIDALLLHYDDPSVGGVGGRVRIPGIGLGPKSLTTGSIRDGFLIGNWNPPITETIEVEHLLGCNMSFRRAIVSKLGGFDNFFRSFNFREESDLCLRIRRLGFRVLFDPSAIVTHMIGPRIQGVRWTYYYVRNTLYLYMVYCPSRGVSFPKFARRLMRPPREYADLSGFRARITPLTLVAATSGIIGGILGFLGHGQ